MNVEISEKQMQELIATKVAAQLDEKLKDGVIGQALAYLSQSTQYGDSSPLIKAFNTTVSNVAEQVVRETIMADDRFMKKVRELVDSCLNEWLDDAEEELKKKMIKGIRAALAGNSYL